MNQALQLILIVSSFLFFLLVFNMVRVKRLELRYAMPWILISLVLLFLPLFPKIIDGLSYLLHIKEAVNTVFLFIIFFLLLMDFTLTLSLSRNANKVKILVQEIGLLKQKQEALEKDVNNALYNKSRGEKIL